MFVYRCKAQQPAEWGGGGGGNGVVYSFSDSWHLIVDLVVSHYFSEVTVKALRTNTTG